MLLLASFWPLRHAQLLEIYLHLFTNALEGEQYVAMKQAFERERNEREQNFQTLKTTVDQTEESVDGLRQVLDSTREDIQKVFNLFDDDQSGHISLRNLKRVAKELGETMSDAELMEMIERADTDGDGEISPDEFYAIMTKKTFT